MNDISNVSINRDVINRLGDSIDTDSSETLTSDISSEIFSFDSTLKSTKETSLDSTIQENYKDKNVDEQILIDKVEDISEIKDDNDERDCVICLEGTNLIKNPFCNCNFFFHEQCYGAWLLNNNRNCILCKKNIDKNCNVTILNIDEQGFINNSLESEINNIIQNESPIINNISSSYIYRTNRIHNANIYIRPLETLEINNNIELEANQIAEEENNYPNCILSDRIKRVLMFIFSLSAVSITLGIFFQE